jgi:hypothetical protein
MSGSGHSRPGYAPGNLLKLYIYGYLNRVRSSRRLEANLLDGTRGVEPVAAFTPHPSRTTAGVKKWVLAIYRGRFRRKSVVGDFFARARRSRRTAGRLSPLTELVRAHDSAPLRQRCRWSHYYWMMGAEIGKP